MEKTASSASSSAAPVVNTAKVKSIGGEIFGTFLGFFKKPVETIKNTYTKFNKDAKSAWIFAGVAVMPIVYSALCSFVLVIASKIFSSSSSDFDFVTVLSFFASAFFYITLFAGLFYATDLEGDKKFWYMFLTYAVVQVCFYIIFSFIVKDLATPALKTGLPILQDAGASAAVNNAVKSTLDSLKSLF